MSYPKSTAAHAIEIAKAEIGYVETPDNITKYGEFTKANGLPWCGSFCNWVLAQAGVKIPTVVSTAVGAHKFKEIGRWHEVPAIGDLAFMDFPHDGVDRISHIGIVVASNTEVEGSSCCCGYTLICRNGGHICAGACDGAVGNIKHSRPVRSPVIGKCGARWIEVPAGGYAGGGPGGRRC